MTSIVTRTGKGAPLSISELDANFTNLNTDKVEKTRVVGAASGELTVTNGGSLSQDIELGLPNTGVSAGTLNNSATQTTPFTVDAKGRVTGTSAPVTLAPAFSSIASKPTTLAGYGITDAQPTITGAASTIDTEDLTASRALASDSSGKVAATSVTATELGYLAGVSQNLQTQLDGKQGTSAKDQANGYAGLNSSGKLSDAVLPDLAISDYLGEVANEAAMLALTGQKGDWCTRTDVGTIYIITGNPASAGGWMQLSYPGTPVKSVAGKTGVVTLDKTDVGLSALTNDAQLKIASNLSDLNSASTARTNLGLGSAATMTGPSGTIVGTSDTQTLTNKTLTSPRVGTAVLDTNGNELIKLTATASAINELTLANAAASGVPTLSATGDDTNISINLAPKGTGTVQAGGVDVVTLSGTQTLTNKTLTTPAISSISNTGTLTLPTSTDTLVGRATTDTLTNKTLSTPVLSGTASGTTAGRLGYLSGALTFGNGSEELTVATLTGTQTFTNKTLTNPTINGFTGGTSVINIGSGQIYKDASGNLGIGTSSPGAKLDVIGNIRFGTTSKAYVNHDGTNAQYVSEAGSTLLYTPVSTFYRWHINNVGQMTLDASGNLGIGTSSPSASAKLTVGRSDSANEGGEIAFCRASDNAAAWAIDISGNSTTPSLRILDLTAGAARVTIDSAGTLILRQSSNAANTSVSFNTSIQNALTLDASGNLGIGTSSPLNLLHVSASSSGGVGGVITTANAAAAAVGNESVIGFRSASQFATTYYSGKIRSIVRNASTYVSDLAFNVYDASGPDGKETLRIDSAGNVGIGTSSPTYILSLGGNAAQTIWMERHTTSNTAGNSLTIQSGGATSGATDKSGGNLLLQSGTATGTGSSVITFSTATAGSTGTTDRTVSEKMRIDGNGNQFATQPAPVAVNASATLTVANLQTRIITATSSTAVNCPLPTGTLMDGWYAGNTDMGVDWCVINLGSSTGAFTVQAGTAHTVVGNMVVAISTSGYFRSRRTAANTWITYRVG